MPTPEQNEQLQIANTILAQMGGWGRIRAMTGAKHPLALSREGDVLGGVVFQFPQRLRGRPNFVRVKLTSADTYRVTFGRCATAKTRGTETTVEGIYADGLVSLFERETGLYLTLARVA